MINYCERHERLWDADGHEECPLCQGILYVMHCVPRRGAAEWRAYREGHERDGDPVGTGPSPQHAITDLEWRHG